MSLRTPLVATVLASVAFLLLASPAEAQRRVRPRQAGAHRPTRAELIRAEYAGVLLQTKRYDEAAAQYGSLVATDSANPAYQLGLARSLAWGGHPREAEPVLARLVRARADTAAATLLVEVRLAVQPSSAEASAWVRESPHNAAYRLALARAYVRERRFPKAFAAFDTLLAAGATVPLLHEAAGVHAAARDSVGNVALLRRAVALSGDNATLRREYAAALTWSGDRRGAIAEYTDLLRRSPDDPELLFLRGRLYVWSGDYAAGERDLRVSLARRPAAEGYTLLGDAYRWRGDQRRSREAYAAALALAPRDTVALAGLAELERLRSGVLAAGATADLGWTAQFNHVEDNAGFLYLAAGIGQNFALGRSTSVGIAAEQRRISERSSRDPERYVYGFALSARAARRFDAVSASATAGIARHGLAGNIPFGDLRLSTGWRSAYLSAVASSGPVYLPLLSVKSLVQFDRSGLVSATPLLGRTLEVAASAPLGNVTVSASTNVTALSDGNRRTSGYLGATLPVAPGVSLLYAGFALGYSGRSDRYWDPTIYNSQSVGAQYQWRDRGPLTLSARVLSGVGRATEVFAGNDGASVRATGPVALQLSTSGEATYRRSTWEIAATAGYARGRSGEYQSLESSLRLRLVR